MKKTIFSMLFLFAVLPLTFGWNSSKEKANLKIIQGEWSILLNNSQLLLKFERNGLPGVKEDRLNYFKISSVKDGKEVRLLDVKASATEDIYIPDRWAFLLEKSSDKKYLLIILKSSWDGEDPRPKPIFIITDGMAVQLRRYDIDDKVEGSWSSEILNLLSKISHEDITQEMKNAVGEISERQVSP